MAVLRSGTRLGPYEILSSVGEGGMGDVYKARDTRLDRIVAVKVSKEEFTPRFETEARATAALEHQHICRLYDVCHDGGASFLVMEYVEGTPLTGPLPLEQALTYARQIAGALDEAHRKQIVHRDLKPTNILVTAKGGVKLLDFGLAKLGRHDTPLDDAALTRGITAAGTILGTLHYMSPEQLQGGVADARSDIFAFGLVLHEMLTGKRAFDGASAASVIAAILERPAPSVAEVAPASLNRLLERCLAKDPDERWQSARDIRAALDLITEPAVLADTNGRSARRPSLWPWLAVGLSSLALAALAFVHFREAPTVAPVARFQILAADGTRIASAPVLSPDGRSIAYVGLGISGGTQIYVRHLDSLETHALPGTDNVRENLFWSPDGRSIGFAADRKLKVASVDENAVRVLCDLEGNLSGGAWSPDGVVIFGAFVRGVFRVPAGGGAPVQLIKASDDEYSLVQPSLLPDGRHFAYLALRRDRTTAIYVSNMDGTERVPVSVANNGSRPTFATGPDGRDLYLVYSRGEALVAQRIDQRFMPVGDAPVLVESIANGLSAASAPSLYSVSSNGVLAFLGRSVEQPTQLTWFDRIGSPRGAAGPTGVFNDLSLSPDETHVAVTRGQGSNDDIWLIDLARNIPTKFTIDPAQDWHPVWAPDGSRLAFSSTRMTGGRTNSIFWKDARNVGTEELLYSSGANERLDDWSPDGKLLLVNHTDGRDDLWIVPVAPDPSSGKRQATPYLKSGGTSESRGQFFPIVMPDGRSWIVYTSNEAGENEIYVESYPRGLQKEQISTAGGMQPRWRRDGKELFYISPDRKMMSVDVTIGPQLRFGVPRELFQTRMSMSGSLVYRMLRYDVTRDGQRFLINSDLESGQSMTEPITVVLNWTQLLKK